MRALQLALAAIGVLAFAPVASADIISDEEGQCRGKAKGDACELGGKPGSCVDSTCGFNDYSGGTPPKAGQRPCLQCQATPAPTKDATPAKTDATPAKTDAAPAKTDTSTPAPAKSGCSIDGAVGPGSAALGLALLVLAARRRGGPR